MEHNVSILRFAVAGAITLIVLFALCWVGALILPSAFSHLFIALFTAAPMTSALALGQGICGALIFGFLGGGILAWSYNLTAWADSKTR